MDKKIKEQTKVLDDAYDDDYPIRILKAYRANCDCYWSDNTSGEPAKSPLLNLMNELNLKRARILDEALEVLEDYYQEKRRNNAKSNA